MVSKSLPVCVTVGVAALSAAAIVGARAQSPGSSAIQGKANVEFLQAVKIAAAEEGIILKLPVREGSRVQAGELLAQVDDRQALAAQEVAEFKHKAARKRADDDIEVRYADAAGDVARLDYLRDNDANIAVPKSVPEIQLRQKKLAWDKAKLQFEKAKNDKVVAAMDADALEAELRAAKLMVERRTVRAPFDGEVQTLFAHEAEWVNPGDPILRLVRLDNLYADIIVDAAMYDPQELENCAVTAVAQLARGRTVQISGRVHSINQEFQGGATRLEYVVRTELKNERPEGAWVLRPGSQVDLTIHLDRKADGRNDQ